MKLVRSALDRVRAYTSRISVDTALGDLHRAAERLDATCEQLRARAGRTNDKALALHEKAQMDIANANRAARVGGRIREIVD